MMGVTLPSSRRRPAPFFDPAFSIGQTAEAFRRVISQWVPAHHTACDEQTNPAAVPRKQKIGSP